jgi:hypothetical protein
MLQRLSRNGDAKLPHLLQKSLNLVGDSSVYLTVCWMFLWPR